MRNAAIAIATIAPPIIGLAIGFGLGTAIWSPMVDHAQRQTREAMDLVDRANQNAADWKTNYDQMKTAFDSLSGSFAKLSTACEQAAP